MFPPPGPDSIGGKAPAHHKDRLQFWPVVQKRGNPGTDVRQRQQTAADFHHDHEVT
jgi:hypothetical protein